MDCPRRLPWAVIGDRRHAPFLVVHGAPTSHGPEPSSPLRSAKQASLRQFLVPAPQQPLLLPTHSDRPPGSRHWPPTPSTPEPEPSSSHPSHPDILQTHNAATTTPNTHPHRQSRLRRYRSHARRSQQKPGVHVLTSRRRQGGTVAECQRLEASVGGSLRRQFKALKP